MYIKDLIPKDFIDWLQIIGGAIIGVLVIIT